ncbi:hypothetical protein HAZT_HAZT000084 [Hyalella azteca]|uniref:Neuroglian n=1 Tax=Hyalella azteca TaxID=294128 RepID=A0A6A0HB24_HYAAZ|nr:hypothetical protein HAZT_HAZT000084 [Hyalella azteca]
MVMGGRQPWCEPDAHRATKKSTTKMLGRQSTSVWLSGYCLLVFSVMMVNAGVIKYPPQMVKQPPSNEELLFQVASRVDENDKPFIIECEAEGEPAPKYRWIKNGKEFAWQTYDDRISQQPGRGTLVITKPKDEDIGQYQCFATNELGTATSNSVFVRKSELNSFAMGDPDSKSVAEGDPDDRGSLRSINSSRKTVDPEGTLWFSNVTREDESNDFTYACAATSTFRNEYKLGNRVLLRVTQSGSTAVQTKNPPIGQFLTRKNTVVLKGKTLKLWCIYSGTEVGFADAGKYKCLAENKFGTEEAEGSLVVKDRTKITEKPQDYEVRAGDAATFRCNAVSDPDLNLSIDWLTDGKKIDFETEPRFIQQSDFSLSISKTTELDSGSYTCVASTELDEVKESATLIVQDAPNAPRLVDVTCNDKDASVEWQPQGDNRAPILGYIIQYNTSFTPDTWENAFDSVPSATTKFTVNLSPYANYTFRVIATNKIGPSLPSKHSAVCTTPIAVPNKNPEGVEGKGTHKNNLVIKWSPMPEIEHNGPGFRYRVYWRRHDKPGSSWNTADVVEWQQDHFVVENQPTFKPYEIKVEAHNEKGQANVAIPTTIGWSGEDRPSEAPLNFKLDNLYDATSARLSWDPVSNASINGHFKGYKIQTWTEDETEAKARDVIIDNNGESSALVESFVPYTRNYARVLVFNGAHDGPPSNTIEFVTPEGSPVDSLEAIPMGSSGFFLIWKKPKRPNGVLTGYHIFYRTVQGTELGPQSERDPPIRDPLVTRAKLARLDPNTKYRISIRARTKVGQGSEYYIERETRAAGSAVPGRPSMLWEHVSSQSGAPAIKLTWIPNTDTNPGSHFYAQYRLIGESLFEKTNPEEYHDFIILEGLQANRIYEVRLVAVDGTYETPSQVEEIETYTRGASPNVTRRPTDNIATRGWFIGMMLAIALLLLILIIVCIIKRNRGGKYAVHEREAAHGRSDFPEETGFPEYSQPLDGGKRDSLGSDVKPPVESDTDSMAEYGDGDAGRFTEDGSFIGQYGTGQRGKKKRSSQEATTPSNVATFV